MIKISSKGGTCHGTQILNEDGKPIAGVRAMTLHFPGPDDLVTAELSIILVEGEIEAHPLLALETVAAAAKHYGFELSPLPPQKKE